MLSTLYLDAARMGRMAPTAQRALQDFVRLVGEEGCTLYFERFLRDGFSTLPATFQARFQGLGSWCGIAELRETVRRHLNLSSAAPILLASRSLVLARFAARWL